MPVLLVQRGHNRDACFFVEEDFFAYHAWLGEALRNTGCTLHAYVLMNNHVHLLLTRPSPEAVSQLVMALGRRHDQYINKTYRRTDTLWDSRYKSSLVHADDYLLLCQRYIELNPVRAEMVSDPAQYRWSSYRANGLGQTDPLITPHAVFLALGGQEPERLAAYRELFQPQLDETVMADIRLALTQGQPLGKGRFLDNVERMTGQRREVRPRGRPRKVASPDSSLDSQLRCGWLSDYGCLYLFVTFFSKRNPKCPSSKLTNRITTSINCPTKPRPNWRACSSSMPNCSA